MPWVGLQCVSVVFPDYNHLLFGSKRFFFSEMSHAAYQIKGNGTLSAMLAHILSLRTPSAPGGGHKGSKHFFRKEVLLHTKLKAMELRALELRAPCNQIYCH